MGVSQKRILKRAGKMFQKMCLLICQSHSIRAKFRKTKYFAIKGCKGGDNEFKSDILMYTNGNHLEIQT